MEDEENEVFDDSNVKRVVIEKLDQLQNASSENVLIPKKLLKKVRELGMIEI